MLDPQVDVDGKRRSSPLSQKEFETKVLAYEKRLDELDDAQILAGLTGINVEVRGDLFIVDVLEEDGTWDQRKSLALEQLLAATDRFSMIPGAPSQPVLADRPTTKMDAKAAVAASAAKPEAPAPALEPVGPPLAAHEIDGRVVLVFPAERFDLDGASALGKRDWDQVVRRSDALTGAMRDQLQRDGARWIAPIEFLSEVFVEGKPLTKPAFESSATVANGVKSLEVHLPRFGEVTLLEIAGKGRFVTTLADATRAAQLVG